MLDNIFTNDIIHNAHNGLIVDTVSDHLPVFAIITCDIKIQDNVKDRFARKSTEDDINAFIDELKEQTWNDVYYTKNVNDAYDIFSETFSTLYDKHCPIVKLSKQNKTKCSKPWFSNGLKNACSKKIKCIKTFSKVEQRN